MVVPEPEVTSASSSSAHHRLCAKTVAVMPLQKNDHSNNATCCHLIECTLSRDL